MIRPASAMAPNTITQVIRGAYVSPSAAY
jgi:hypothetical protein